MLAAPESAPNPPTRFEKSRASKSIDSDEAQGERFTLRHAFNRVVHRMTGAQADEEAMWSSKLSPAAHTPPEVPVKPAVTKQWMADGHLSHFTDSDQQLIRSTRKQMVLLRVLEPVSTEDEHMLLHASKTVEKSIDLAKRADDLSPEKRSEVLDGLRQTMKTVLTALELRVAEKAAGAI